MWRLNKVFLRIKMGEYENGEEKRAPKGHFVVYVGVELKRCVLPLSYLKNYNFQKLLEKAAQEFGYSSNRSIVIPCEESTFNKVMDQIKYNSKW